MAKETGKSGNERAINSEGVMLEHPMTTEEPIDHPALEKELARLNEVNEEDHVPKDIIEPAIEPNKIPDSADLYAPDAFHETEEYADHEAEAEAKADKELWMTTEANRFIPNDDIQRGRSISIKRINSNQRNMLVFADNPSVIEKKDRIIVANHYGAGPLGEMDVGLKPTRKRRSYMVACDFSDESFYALEWTMGTMMRDGDELHVVTVVNREDNPDAVKQAGMTLAKELKAASNAVTDEAKKTLSHMQLFDVKLVTYAMSGKVKDVLSTQIQELPLTMVVCGSRGRNSMKRMLMGSISTYLVHKSTVPVSVIRPLKKKKHTHAAPVEAPPLSQSMYSKALIRSNLTLLNHAMYLGMMTGQLAVDELSQHKKET